jgi:hypothetical protein
MVGGLENAIPQMSVNNLYLSQRYSDVYFNYSTKQVLLYQFLIVS